MSSTDQSQAAAPTTTDNNNNSTPPSPWHAAYPAPSTLDPPTLTRTEVLQRFQQGKRPGKDFILVDLRRMDHEGGTIRGSINLPAQSLYPSIPTLYELFSTAAGGGAGSITEVIFYCGSSKGRAPRAASWFQDHINNQHNQSNIMKSYILHEGITGWAMDPTINKDEFMDGYDERVWVEKSKKAGN